MYYQDGTMGLSTLSEIEQQVIACKACDLYKQPFLPVPGVGTENADLFVCAEAPGFVESDPAQYNGPTGVPLVGPAGLKLQETLASLGFGQFSFFVTNVIKHRPPNNRDPSPFEKTTCSKYLLAQILVVKPRAILALGRHAIDTIAVLGNQPLNSSINTAQFTFKHELPGYPIVELRIPVYGAFHPSYILRNPTKFDAWHSRLYDVQQALEDLCRTKTSLSGH